MNDTRVNKPWVVLKFGGSSVCKKQHWDTIASLAQQRLEEGYRVLLVCSAVAGITNDLQYLADHADHYTEAEINAVLARHRQLSTQLMIQAEDIIGQAGEDIGRSLLAIVAAADSNQRNQALASLLAVGEWLSTRLGERYLCRTLPLQWVDSRQVLQSLPEQNPMGRRAWLSARCNPQPDRHLIEQWSSKTPVLITQGFVASHPGGGTVLLGRGGSDTTAALLAGRLAANRVEIWTDVPGLFSADPREIPDARLLQTLDYDEALEMAAGGAKVVNSRCIRAAAHSHTPIMIRDLGNPDFVGTVIGSSEVSSNEVEAGIRCVCEQKNMAVLLLKNMDTREHIGFLSWVFRQVSEAGISVDGVATSETTTTLALNRSSNHIDEHLLNQITQTLSTRCAVRVYPQCCGIHLVGRGARVALAGIDPQAAFFSSHPLLMLSQSANDLCISLLVNSVDARQLLDSLHDTFIPKVQDNCHRAEVFGPSWRDIRCTG